MRRSHPKAIQGTTETANDTLTESEKLYGRDVVVKYIFKNDDLVIYIITFAQPSSNEDFLSTQTKLSAEYAAMGAPAPKGSCVLSSSKTFGRFVMEHCLRKTSTEAVYAEQIIAVRTKAQ